MSNGRHGYGISAKLIESTRRLQSVSKIIIFIIRVYIEVDNPVQVSGQICMDYLIIYEYQMDLRVNEN